ncbi:hypothetical protein L6164_031732 [Bauhinia variegata]|uniref:Uncharacterized protein n=1 Tax=Bauhinia variegata TaxID=167791 RepID=A0ACB9KM74_BAUVA|nr:hypothetical protein L6164_031732 [Bauhinia variegata]
MSSAKGNRRRRLLGRRFGLEGDLKSSIKRNRLNLKEGDWLLPESVLREDDALCHVEENSSFGYIYESVKAYIERDFGAIETENPVVQDDVQSIEVSGINRIISSCLDNLTTKGLYLLAMILTGGSVKFEITRCKMKKIIKNFLSSVLGRKNLNHNQLENFKSIFHVLSSPQNFWVNCRTSTSRSESRHAAVLKVLDGLQDFPCQTLIAMRRKLKGIGSVPQKIIW